MRQRDVTESHWGVLEEESSFLFNGFLTSDTEFLYEAKYSLRPAKLHIFSCNLVRSPQSLKNSGFKHYFPLLGIL